MQDRNANKTGYKKTKIGWMPQDWVCRKGYEITDLIAKGASPKWQGFEYSSQGMLFITIENVRNGYLDIKKKKYLPIEFHKKIKRSALKRGDILINLVGASIGRSCLVDEDLGDANINQAVNVFRLREGVTKEYIALFFQWPSTIRRIIEMQVDAARPIISLSDLRNFIIPLPSPPEQRAIVGILSKWGSVINKTRKLIVAENNRKKALMQQLLDGNTASHWKVMPLSKAFKRIQRVTTDDIDDILSATANVGFVHQNDKFSRVIAGKNLSRYILLKKGEFAYNKGNSKSYPQGCVYILNEYEQGAVPNVYFCFKPRTNEILGQFYKYYFEAGLLNHQLYRIINTGVRNDGLLNLNPKDFFNISILVPSVNEQRRIADIFTTIDFEIISLKNELTALQKQKRGLMQKLLTGEVRVKV